jgi:hypothetical protein
MLHTPLRNTTEITGIHLHPPQNYSQSPLRIAKDLAIGYHKNGLIETQMPLEVNLGHVFASGAVGS